MPPSKLDKYMKILEAVLDRPKKLDQISRKTMLEAKTLKRQLQFLVTNGVIEIRGAAPHLVAYAITDRGVSVFKTLRALKYLEKLKETLPIVEEAREIASILSQRSRIQKD